jgi:hypothetical protein
MNIPSEVFPWSAEVVGNTGIVEGACHSENPAKRPTASSVYFTVFWMLLWPR